jgi:hypothetical protein
MPARTVYRPGTVDPLIILPKPKQLKPLPAAAYKYGQEQLQTTQQMIQQQGRTTPDPNIQYPHPQPWRAGYSQQGGHMGAGMNLGAYGDPIQPEVILSIELNPQMFVEVEKAAKYVNQQRITESFLLERIRTEVYLPLRMRLWDWINQLAPKDSGATRNALELSVAGGTVPGGSSSATSQINGLHPFYVVLSTGNIPYAKIANNMPSPWLKHNGPTHQGTLSSRYGRTQQRRAGPHELFDPNAQQNWFETILYQGRIEARRLWSYFEYHWIMPFVTPLANKIGLSVNLIIDGLFQVVIP